MGANLLGWHAKGPAQLKITPQQRRQIVDQLLPLAVWWRQIDGGENWQGELDGCPVPLSRGEIENWPELFEEMMAWLSPPELERPRLRGHLTKFVKRLLAQWAPEARDATYMEDPDDPGQINVFAGEMSWGDEPDGEGYRLFKQLYATGVGRAVGIRPMDGFVTLTLDPPVADTSGKPPKPMPKVTIRHAGEEPDVTVEPAGAVEIEIIDGCAEGTRLIVHKGVSW